MTKLSDVYPHARYLSLFLLGGAIFLLLTDTMPFTYSFRLSFEYGALFYPALASVIFASIAFWIYWRSEFRHDLLPLLSITGFIAVFFCLFQTVFTVIALAMYNYDIVVSGSGGFNFLGLSWITFRMYAVVQGCLTLLLIRWSQILYQNPGAEMDFLRSMAGTAKRVVKNRPVVIDASNENYNPAMQSSYNMEKSREETV